MDVIRKSQSGSTHHPGCGHALFLFFNLCSSGFLLNTKMQGHTVKVVDMRVEAAGLGESWVEAELPVPDVPRPPERQPGGHRLDMALAQRVVDHVLILLHLTNCTHPSDVVNADMTDHGTLNGNQVSSLTDPFYMVSDTRTFTEMLVQVQVQKVLPVRASTTPLARALFLHCLGQRC